MHRLWKLQGAFLPWGTQMSWGPVHIPTRQLTSVPWGHQEVPAKFNFASDVVEHWAGLEKVTWGRRDSPAAALLVPRALGTPAWGAVLSCDVPLARAAGRGRTAGAGAWEARVRLRTPHLLCVTRGRRPGRVAWGQEAAGLGAVRESAPTEA